MKTAYLLLRTKHGKTRLVIDRLLKFEQIVEMHELFGRYDIVCKVETESDKELKLFMQNKLWITEDIDRCETLLVADLLEDDSPEFHDDAHDVTSVSISDDEDDDMDNNDDDLA